MATLVERFHHRFTGKLNRGYHEVIEGLRVRLSQPEECWFGVRIATLKPNSCFVLAEVSGPAQSRS
jgi:hypothetical protein